MILRNQFTIDRIQILNAKDPDVIIEQYKTYHEKILGHIVSKFFPHKKIESESYSGPIPESSLNKDHQFTDVYRTEFIALTLEQWQLIKTELSGAVLAKLEEMNAELIFTTKNKPL
jgi:hypothetical protein